MSVTITDTDNSISIHAPLRERLDALPAALLADIISIHAPLRERPSVPTESVDIHLFQSTLPYGSDKEDKQGFFSKVKFQSTLPYGSDLELP